MLKPINDLAMVELETSKYKFGDPEQDHKERGILVAIPAELPFFGFNSFAFENSYGNPKALEKTRQYYRGHIGDMVYWSEYSERGSVIKYRGKEYAFLKLTSLICADDDLDSAGSVVPEVKAGGMAFRV